MRLKPFRPSEANIHWAS